MEKMSQWMPRSFWRGMSAAILFILALLIWLLLRPGPDGLFLTVDILALPLSLLTGMVISFSGKPRWWNLQGKSLKEAIRTSSFWTPAIFLLICICHLAGQIITASIMLTSMQPAKASWADFFFLSSYPLVIIFFFLLPTRAASQLSHTRVVLNTLIIMTTVVTFSWYFVLGPTLLQQTSDLLDKLAPSAYPVGDLILIFCLVQLASRAIDARMRLGVFMLILALSFLVLNDSVYEYQTLQGTYTLGTLFDLCVPMCYLCYGLAVQAIRMAHARQLQVALQQQQEAEPSKQISIIPSFWLASSPYVFIPAMIVLAFCVLLQGETGPLAWGVYAGAFLLIILVLIRQVLLLRTVTTYASMTERLNEELSKANSSLEALATTDPLTGLPNHRSLQTTLTYELERAQRYQHACSLLFLDVDHFKALNDGYGHAAGDEVLIAFSQRLSQNLRATDIPGRWGGEEFLIILPETPLQEAQEIAERIHAAIHSQPFAVGGGSHITCSIGIASYPIHATALNNLVNAADQAMYAAKRLGRNQYRVIDDPAVQLILASESNQGGREEAALHGLATGLASLLEQRDATLGEHSREVAALARRLAVHMGISDQEANMIHLGGLLHDIGKIGIPDAILHKSTPLTADERELIKQYPVIGARTIACIPALRPLAPVIGAQREHWDGTGSPDQLEREDIPLAARVIAVADAYVTQIIGQPHQQAYTSEDALQHLHTDAGAQFDPIVVQALTDILADQREQSAALAIVHANSTSQPQQTRLLAIC